MRQALAGMVTHTDEMIGDIVRQWGFLDWIRVSLAWKVSRLLQVAALKGTAAWDNTLVVFSPTQPPDTYLAILPRPGPHCMLLEP